MGEVKFKRLWKDMSIMFCLLPVPVAKKNLHQRTGWKFFFFFPPILEIEPRTLRMLGERGSVELAL